MKTFIAITLGLTLVALSLSACGHRKKHQVAQPVPTATYGTGFGYGK
ncbi:MAG: hypothetical protein KGR69_09305 [Verrucomicrobia bacterium]|jgi:hypothetical protein|nr:hypothetical protein [Verrucomicrobiota bacterium]